MDRIVGDDRANVARITMMQFADYYLEEGDLDFFTEGEPTACNRLRCAELGIVTIAQSRTPWRLHTVNS